LLAACLLSPAVTRVCLLIDGAFLLTLVDARGFVSDLAMAIILLALLTLLSRRPRWVTLAGIAVWCLFNHANYEYARELGANLRLSYVRYLADPVFLQGSALAPSRPGLLVGVILASLTLGLLATRRGLVRPRALRVLIIGCIVLGASVVWPQKTDALFWRQVHFLPENLASTWQRSRTPSESSDASPLFAADLEGEPLLPMPRRNTNVLLVVLEGIPGAYIDSIAEAHGVESSLSMPRLSSIAERALVATTFVLHQRQTNRGMYSILCGDYPKLDQSMPKMTEYLQGGSRRCLPRVLKDQGYETIYLQGAPLGFMFKGAFMPRIGFDRVHGNAWFETPHHRSKWGVDDRTLFESAREVIGTLQARKRPWFMTLLTVGTHHPFSNPTPFSDSDAILEVPTALEGRLSGAGLAQAARDYPKALEYVDNALAQLLEDLEMDGVLENTLVLITSDESKGIQSVDDDLSRTLSQSWGFLIAIEPTGAQLRQHQVMGHSDLALSVLDYTGIDHADTEFMGRSVFRSYPTERLVYFSNTFLRIMGAMHDSGAFYLCTDGALDCSKYFVASRRFFGVERTPRELGADEFSERHAVIEHSLRSAGEREALRHWPLLENPDVTLLGGDQNILGGQSLQVPPNSWFALEVNARLEGRNGGVTLINSFRDAKGGLFRKTVSLRAGEVLRLVYVDSRPETTRVGYRLNAMNASKGLVLRFEQGRISYGPADKLPASFADSRLGVPDIRIEKLARPAP
jgi:arylsulfatase A-like enzyme